LRFGAGEKRLPGRCTPPKTERAGTGRVLEELPDIVLKMTEQMFAK